MKRFFGQTGGIQHMTAGRSRLHLSAVEREEISRGIAAGESARRVARRLGRTCATLAADTAGAVGGHDWADP